MSEKIEQAARRMWESQAGDNPLIKWEDMAAGLAGDPREDFRKMARIAFETLREPTRAMIEAGHRADPLGYCDVDPSDIEQCYGQTFNAMIDAALEGK